MVLISKKNRRTILEYIFKEGVITVEKAGHKEKHDDINVPNLEVMMIVKSLVSRGYLKNTFNWQWNYCFVTDDGLNYLREVLSIPAHVAPITHTKQRANRPLASAAPGGEQERPRKGGKGGGGWGKGGGKGYGGGGYSGGGAWGQSGPDGDYKPEQTA